jgi:polyphosphate glucokinase
VEGVHRSVQPAWHAPRLVSRTPNRRPAAKRSGVRRQAPLTLGVDVGGTGVKGSVVDASGSFIADRVRVPTPYPCSPQALIEAIREVVAGLPRFDRASMGFPGVVRKGLVLSAPEFVAVAGLGSPVDPRLVKAWDRFDLAGAFGALCGTQVRVANDADMQGAGVVSGRGLELVVTLGTSFGSAVFQDGRLGPHLELAHHPFRKGETYAEQLGEPARKHISPRKWNRRVELALETLDRLLLYDRVYIGGGNAQHVAAGLGPKVSIVNKAAGILGGVRIWELPE